MRYDQFESNEALHAKLLAGVTGYELGVQGSLLARLRIDAGLQEFDKSKILNLANLEPGIRA